MKKQYKLAIALMPCVFTALILSSLTFPKIGQDQEKNSELDAKRHEYTMLQNKLHDRKQAEQQKLSLESEITALRGAVPKAPELDLMMLDLEKMCSETGVDLVAVETPTQETLKGMVSSDDEMKALLGASEGKTMGVKSASAPGKVDATKATSKSPDDTGLKRLVKQVFVTGEYNGIVALMKKLEAYQRVVGVSQLAVAVKTDNSNSSGTERNAASERAQKFGFKQPMMSFLLTLYYLP